MEVSSTLIQTCLPIAHNVVLKIYAIIETCQTMVNNLQLRVSNDLFSAFIHRAYLGW